MAPFRLTVLALCLLAPAGSLAADGELHVYLQAFPPDAARIAFEIASVSAVTADGAEHSLELRLPRLNAAEAGRQRLLASGRVRGGTYAAIAFRLRRASLRSEQGQAALLVPDTPVRVDVAFTVAGQRGVVLWLTLKYQESLSGSVSFAPAFAATLAPRPILSLAGFVSNSTSNAITVFDKSRGLAAAVIPTCSGPGGMALGQPTGRLYVACPDEDEILAIDVAAAEVVLRSRALPGDGPRELALTPDGRTLISVNAGSDSISVFAAASLTRLERVPVGSGPSSVQIDPTGRRAFVFNTLSGSISVVDIASRSPMATIATDSAPLRGRFNGRGDRLYVVHERAPYLTVVDPLQLTVVRRERLRMGIGAIEVDGRRGLVYLGGRDEPTVEVYEPNALVPIDAIRIRRGVSHLAIDAEENHLYMVSPDTGSVLVGNLADRKVIFEIDVGEGPCWVSVMGEK